MGSIIVGQKRPQTVNMGGITVSPSKNDISEKKQELSSEENARIVKNIMTLPKEQIVPALRKNGFNDIADITEAEMKADAEAKAKADAREKRLAEIMALPVYERLPLLLAEGYEDEAKKLSEELAAEQKGESSVKAEDTTAEEIDGDKTAEAGDGDGETEPKKKKAGRPKKSEE